MRYAIEIIVGVNALAGLIGLALRRRQRRLPSWGGGETHAEAVARLKRENEELDKLQKEIQE